jgi:hypothetical protein
VAAAARDRALKPGVRRPNIETVMTITAVEARVAQIATQITGLQSAFTPPSAAPASAAASTTGGSLSFRSKLASAMSPASAASSATSVAAGGSVAGAGAVLPANASTMLTPGQQQFASQLAANTGLDPGVVSSWLLAEESGGAATSRQANNNNDWLNIGYTDSGTYGSADSVWANPITAANATAGWLKGQNTIPGYGTASSGVQAILATAGQPPATQISALQTSGWASSGYPGLTSLYQQVAG